MFWGGCGDDTGPTNVRPAGQPHALRAQQASAAGRAAGKFPTIVAASGNAVPAAAGRYGAARHNCCRAPALCFARAARARGRGIPDSSTAPSSPADTALFPHGSRGESERRWLPLPSAERPASPEEIRRGFCAKGGSVSRKNNAISSGMVTGAGLPGKGPAATASRTA
jgi:hypothetical protein